MVSKNITKQNIVKQSKKNNKNLKGGFKSTNNKSLKINNNKVMKGGKNKKHKVSKLLKGGAKENEKPPQVPIMRIKEQSTSKERTAANKKNTALLKEEFKNAKKKIQNDPNNNINFIYNCVTYTTIEKIQVMRLFLKFYDLFQEAKKAEISVTKIINETHGKKLDNIVNILEYMIQYKMTTPHNQDEEFNANNNTYVNMDNDFLHS